MKKELTKREEAAQRIWMGKVLAEAEAEPPMSRMLQAFEDLDESQPFNEEQRAIYRTFVVPRATTLMARLQTSDSVGDWKNQPKDARALFELISAIADLLWSGPPFGSIELLQRDDLDKDAKNWRPRDAMGGT